MKKIYLAMAVLAAAALNSCQQEKSITDITVGENEIAFVLQSVSTRSEEESTGRAEKGITIPIKNLESGETLFLEETIEELNPAPATKGAPAYTINVGKLYSTMGVHAGGKFGDVVFERMDDGMYDHKGTPNDPSDPSAPTGAGSDEMGDGWRYWHNYGSASPWPDKETPVDFYMHMPATMSGVEFDEDEPYKDKVTKFELTSPKEGAAQQDILFAQTTINKKTHDGYLPNGAPVMMYHALTGIKFRNGHPNDNETKTIITRVELIGLKGYGKCTFNGTNNTFDWPSSDLDSPSTATDPFYQEFSNPTYKKEDGKNNSDGTVGTNDWNKDLANTSWTSAAADRNLNDKDGSLTFWFIPQEITNEVKLKVYFTVKTPDSVDGFLTEACHTINLGEKLNERYQSVEGNSGKNLKWEAGQLRTYTLAPYDVDVDIKDSMTSTVKSGLHVANTGNVDEYVRMLVIGNWYGWTSQDSKDKGDEPSILVGYKYKDAADAASHEGNINDMVDPWFREGQDTNGDGKTDRDIYGTFDSTFPLAKLGNRDGKRDDWADASGGFYYTMPIGPGESLSNATAGTADLFKNYTLDPQKIPTIYLSTSATTREPAVGVHLRMEIVVQAIAVPKDENGEDVWWLQAWYDATKIPKLAPDYVNSEGKKPNEKFVTLYTNGEYAPENSQSN